MNRTAFSWAQRAPFVLFWGLGPSAIGACDQVTIPPLSVVAGTQDSCGYPRGCYLVECSCQGGPSGCRVIRAGAGTGQSGADAGLPQELLLSQEAPKPSDSWLTCPATTDGGPTLDNKLPAMRCATPETVCVARGPKCAGSCVRKGGACGVSSPVIPQMGGDGASYCPYGDDVCCAKNQDLGVSSDMSAADMSQDLK